MYSVTVLKELQITMTVCRFSAQLPIYLAETLSTLQQLDRVFCYFSEHVTSVMLYDGSDVATFCVASKAVLPHITFNSNIGGTKRRKEK